MARLAPRTLVAGSSVTGEHCFLDFTNASRLECSVMNRESHSETAESFSQQAEAAQSGLVSEMVDFLLENKKWWLTPIILVLLLTGLLVLLSGSAAAPFIYTLF